jgi:hypothetical protein
MVNKMKKWMVIAITIVLAALAFSLSPVLWPRHAGEVSPTSIQIGLLIFVSAIEAIAFGFGIALIFIAAPRLRAVRPEAKSRTGWALASIIWLLISWWPHDNWHASIGENYGALIALEYGFHLTLIIAGLIITNYFLKNLREKI